MVDRPGLAESYPVGTPRAEILKKYGTPNYTTMITAGKKLEIGIENCLQHMKDMGLPKPARYDVFSVSRLVQGSSARTVALYFDYVFYDEAGIVIWSQTRFDTA